MVIYHTNTTYTSKKKTILQDITCTAEVKYNLLTLLDPTCS